MRHVLVAVCAGLLLLAMGGWQRWMDVSVLPLPPEEIPTAQWRRCPDEGGIINVEWRGRPETWSETVAGADLIVVAKRLADPPRVEDRGDCDFLSHYAFTILESGKGKAGVGDRLTVGFLGRPQDRVDDLPHPETGEPLVLFLKVRDGNYRPAFGPGGIVRVVEGIVAPYSVTDGLSGVLGRPVDSFLTSLRQYAEAK